MTELVSVPREVARTAALALSTRAERGSGGTARGVVIATALAAGVLSACELAELRDWHARNIEQVRDGTSTLLAGLYGGAPARETWPASLLVDVDDEGLASVQAAAQTAIRQRLAKLSRTVATVDQRLLARLHAAATQALEEAVAQAAGKLTARTKAAASRSKANATRIASALSESGGTVTPAVLAALGLDEQDLLDGRFATFAATATALLSAAELRKLRAAAIATGQDPAALEETYGPTIDTQAAAATAFLIASLGLLARQSLSGHALVPAQGEYNGPVPFGVVRNAFTIASRGVSAPIPTETGVGSSTAELVGRKLADAGQSLVEKILADSTEVTGPVVSIKTWTVGDPARPFEPHQALDGVTWDTEDYPEELAADPGEWPYVDVYEVGDHDGCDCSIVEDFQPVEEPVGTSQGLAEDIVTAPEERRDLVSSA